MNRRSAVKRISLVAGGLALSFSGVEVYRLYRHPDLSALDRYKGLLDEIAECIIPRTDSPGAGGMGIGAFIIKMVRDCTGRTAQNNFIYGIESLASYTESRYNKPFGRCTVKEQAHILGHFGGGEQVTGGKISKAERKVLGDPFFTTLKKYVVLGFCTSRPGATQALRYDYIPGKYVPVALSPGDKAWATQ